MHNTIAMHIYALRFPYQLETNDWRFSILKISSFPRHFSSSFAHGQVPQLKLSDLQPVNSRTLRVLKHVGWAVPNGDQVANSRLTVGNREGKGRDANPINSYLFSWPIWIRSMKTTVNIFRTTFLHRRMPGPCHAHVGTLSACALILFSKTPDFRINPRSQESAIAIAHSKRFLDRPALNAWHLQREWAYSFNFFLQVASWIIFINCVSSSFVETYLVDGISCIFVIF